jgi:hypothetical protein
MLEVILILLVLQQWLHMEVLVLVVIQVVLLEVL